MYLVGLKFSSLRVVKVALNNQALAPAMRCMQSSAVTSLRDTGRVRQCVRGADRARAVAVPRASRTVRANQQVTLPHFALTLVYRRCPLRVNLNLWRLELRRAIRFSNNTACDPEERMKAGLPEPEPLVDWLPESLSLVLVHTRLAPSVCFNFLARTLKKKKKNITG